MTADDVDMGAVFRTFNTRECSWSGLENHAKRTEGIALRGHVLVVKTPASAEAFADTCDRYATMLEWVGYPAPATELRDLRDRLERSVQEADQ
jgi:hypothetical protein